MAWITKIFSRRNIPMKSLYEPSVTLFIPAYNEADYVVEKVKNSLELDYPREKLQIMWIADGSTDNTVSLLIQYPEMHVMHRKERQGKINAIKRGIKASDPPIVIFTDANTLLNKKATR